MLLKTEESPGRLDTPGALVRNGTKLESNVLSPLAAPEIAAGQVSQHKQPVKLTPTQTREVMAALRKTVKDGSCELVDTKSDDAGKPEVRRLTNDRLPVSHACRMAAHNSGDGYRVVDTKPPYSAVLVTTFATDYADRVITSAQKGRGVGDCFSSATWTWTRDGNAFAPRSATTTAMCRQIVAGGAWEFSDPVTRVRKPR